MRTIAARLINGRAFETLVSLLERATPSSARRFAVLTYHRVDDPRARPELYPGLISASPVEFAEQMRFLAARCRPLSMTDLLAARAEGRVPPRSVVVTFDDAYRDFLEHAWPALRAAGVPVALFVPTGYPGGRTSFWWDRLWAAINRSNCRALRVPGGELPLTSERDRVRAYRRLRREAHAVPHTRALELVDRWSTALGEDDATTSPVLSWDELRALAANGVTVAPHSQTHARLDRIPTDHLRAEVVGSIADVRREIGTTPPVFAYPAGGHDSSAVEALKGAGVRAAFSTHRGVNHVVRADWMRLNRINVGSRSGLPAIRAQLALLALSRNR